MKLMLAHLSRMSQLRLEEAGRAERPCQSPAWHCPCPSCGGQEVEQPPLSLLTPPAAWRTGTTAMAAVEMRSQSLSCCWLLLVSEPQKSQSLAAAAE